MFAQEFTVSGFNTGRKSAVQIPGGPSNSFGRRSNIETWLLLYRSFAAYSLFSQCCYVSRKHQTSLSISLGTRCLWKFSHISSLKSSNNKAQVKKLQAFARIQGCKLRCWWDTLLQQRNTLEIMLKKLPKVYKKWHCQTFPASSSLCWERCSSSKTTFSL